MMMAAAVVILDTCVLISFAQVHRFDILSGLSGVEFFTTEHVLGEITDEKQREQVELQIRSGLISVCKLTNPDIMQMFFEMRKYIGSGEASCIALARENNWIVGSDDKQKVPRMILEHLGKDRLTTTRQLLQKAVNQGVLDSEEADNMQKELEDISTTRVASKVSTLHRNL